jgi:hypothetical protein
MKRADRRIKLDEAIARLAALFEYGELQASTDPAGFLHRCADEIERLRKPGGEK